MNIYITGYRATGKTTIGKLIARKLGMQFIDADVYLEEKTGKIIKNIFADEGEGAFRKYEKDNLKEIASWDNYVVATGGGVVLDKENVAVMKASGVCVLLTASAEEIYDRLTRDHKTQTQRPALTDKNAYDEIVHLLDYREPFYKEAADIAVDTEGKNIMEVADIIIATLQSKEQL